MDDISALTRQYHTLAKFDETICLFKFIENNWRLMRLNHRICEVYLLVLHASTIGILGDLSPTKSNDLFRLRNKLLD